MAHVRDWFDVVQNRSEADPARAVAVARFDDLRIFRDAAASVIRPSTA